MRAPPSLRRLVRRHPRLAHRLGRVLAVLRHWAPTLRDARDFVAQANALAHQGRHEQAVGVLEAGLAKDPRHMQAHETLIQVLVHLGRNEQALDACARALEQDGESDAILASLNVVLSTLRGTTRPDDVIRSLNRCVVVIPQNFDVVLLLTELLLKMNRFADAVQACELALRLDPEFVPALETIKRISKDPAAQSELSGMKWTETLRISDEYSRVAAENVAEFLTHVMTTFYGRLGADPQDAPLVQGLNRFRWKLALSQGDIQAEPTGGILVSFEQAWSRYQAGKVDETVPLFEAIFRDRSARRKAVHNPHIKEAVIRSGEIVGRRHDTLGNMDLAISVYREIMTLDHNSIIAGRLLVLLSRSGDLRGAAELAEEAIVSRTNLYPRLIESSYIASLKEEIAQC
jgi:tetratricopeptide (TPR) repeat protein